jgi:hypothetical protein
MSICQPQSLHREWFETMLKITSSSDQCHFAIEQTEVDPGVWRVTELDFNFKGSILIFKSLNIKCVSTHSSFDVSQIIYRFRTPSRCCARMIPCSQDRFLYLRIGCWALEADCQSIAL